MCRCVCVLQVCVWGCDKYRRTIGGVCHIHVWLRYPQGESLQFPCQYHAWTPATPVLFWHLRYVALIESVIESLFFFKPSNRWSTPQRLQIHVNWCFIISICDGQELSTQTGIGWKKSGIIIYRIYKHSGYIFFHLLIIYPILVVFFSNYRQYTHM